MQVDISTVINLIRYLLHLIEDLERDAKARGKTLWEDTEAWGESSYEAAATH